MGGLAQAGGNDTAMMLTTMSGADDDAQKFRIHIIFKLGE